jgi:hypothetical protein
MTNGRWACLSVLMMCAPISGRPQTPASEVRARQTPSNGLNANIGDVNAREHDQLARRFVDETLTTWRRRLNLEQWDISIVMTRRSDLKPRTRGKIRWDKDKRSAVIFVMDASDYQLPLREMLDDMEFTIVHELIHLELASLPRSEASRSSEEHAVNRIAAALLRLARQQ